MRTRLSVLLGVVLLLVPAGLRTQSDVPHGKSDGECDVYAPPGFPDDAKIPEGQLISCWPRPR